MKKRAVFLDRDGTICEEVNYLSRAEDLRLFSFAAEAVKILNENNFSVISITNQSGIARKFFDENDLREIHQKLENDLAKSGAKLDAIYYCPHNSADDCLCRKPKTGLIKRALNDFEIDLQNSWMIGDKAIDIQTGFNAETKTALVLTGYGQNEIEELEIEPDLIVKDLLEAAKFIIRNS